MFASRIRTTGPYLSSGCPARWKKSPPIADIRKIDSAPGLELRNPVEVDVTNTSQIMFLLEAIITTKWRFFSRCNLENRSNSSSTTRLQRGDSCSDRRNIAAVFLDRPGMPPWDSHLDPSFLRNFRKLELVRIKTDFHLLNHLLHLLNLLVFH